MKRIIVATDLSERSDRAIDRAIQLANKFAAPLTILHVVDEDLPTPIANQQHETARQNLRDHISSIAGAGTAKIDISIQFGRDWIEILRQAEAGQAELIVLGVHRERGLEGLFRGTTVERALRNGDAPVLVVKNRAAREYRRVIVGVDFSVYSRRAVEFALHFAPDATIHLVHAFDFPFKSFLAGPESRSGMRQRDEVELVRMIDHEMSGFLAGLEADMGRIEKVMQEGGPDEVIAAKVTALDADLLVLGTHGRTGVAHAFLGSIAEMFLADPPCDVVAVKAW
jgi:nucleotide-binding universal stress UspA family protein